MYIFYIFLSMENRDYNQNPNNTTYRENVTETNYYDNGQNKKNNLLPLLIWLLVLWWVGAAVYNMNKNPSSNNWIIKNIQNTVAQVVPGQNTKFSSFEEFYKAQLTPATTYLAQAQNVASFDKASWENNFSLKLNSASWNSFSAPEMSANLNGKMLAKYIMSQKYLDANINLKWDVDLKQGAGIPAMTWAIKDLNLGLRILANKIYVNFGALNIESPSIPQAQLVQAMYWNFLNGQWVEIPLSGQDAASLANSFDTTSSTKFIAALISWAQAYPLLNGQKIADGDYTTYAVSLNKQNFPAMIQAVANDPATKKMVSYPGNEAEYASWVAQAVNSVNEALKNINLSWMLYLKDSNDYKLDISSLTFSWDASVNWSIVKKWNDITSSFTTSALSGWTMKAMAKIDTKTSWKNTNFVITNLETNKVFLKWDINYDINFDNNGSKADWKLNFSDESGKLNWSLTTTENTKKDDSIVVWTVPTNVKTIDQLMSSFGGAMGWSAAMPSTTTTTTNVAAPVVVTTSSVTITPTSVTAPGVSITTN